MAATAIHPARRTIGTFYVWMAALCVLIAFGGFAPTYWLQLPPGTFIGPPLLHIHGAAVLGLDTALADRRPGWPRSGRMHHHRAWGLAGIALGTAMVVVGLTAAVYSLNVQIAAGYGDKARGFCLVP